MPIEIPTAPTQPAVLSLSRVKFEMPRGRRRPGARERMFFSERLSLLLETGVALHPALEALRDQTANPAMKAVLAQLMEDVSGGRPFADALAGHPGIFPVSYVNLVAAGEKGGFLHAVLHQLLKMDEKREKLRRTLVTACTYPAFLILFSFAVVVFILTVVFPKFGTLFHAIRDQLPITTVALMALSDLVRQYWIALLAVLGASGFGLSRWIRRPEAQVTLDRLKLQLPLVRTLFGQLYLVTTLRVLGLSLTNGVGLLEALAGCRDLVRNRVYRNFIERLETLVNEGRGLTAGFSEAAFVPSMARQMIATGEDTGNLPLVMGRVAEFYEGELEKRVTTLSKVAEPLMLLVMGVLVGVIVSSLILPIFKLSKAVH